ncbi:MAG: hypothetical protein GF313_10075 [Caldithrix sp.]|nr:hypothetical protein [Caldithrix sp.]
MRKYIIIGLMLGLTAGIAQAQNGGNAGAYLRMGLGARSTSLGNAGAADVSNGFSFYYNPALTSFLDAKVGALSYSFLSLDRQFNFIGYGMDVAPGGGLALALINTGVDDITGYNSVGEQTGEIGHSANAAYFNFSRKFFNKFSIGLTIKYLWESLDVQGDDDYQSQGVGVDAGLLYKITPTLQVAAVVRDINSQLKANTENLFEFGGTTVDKFPTLYIIGARYQTPLPWLSVLYDYERSTKNDDRHHFGVETSYQDRLGFRLGLNHDRLMAGAGMGFKILSARAKLDYVFVPPVTDEGSSHIFSWQFILP